MVNVSILTMGQARGLGVEGALLREFGLAALMHDIGKVRTPNEILNKPDKLTDDDSRDAHARRGRRRNSAPHTRDAGRWRRWSPSNIICDSTARATRSVSTGDAQSWDDVVQHRGRYDAMRSQRRIRHRSRPTAFSP